jgi:hypothetical protein
MEITLANMPPNRFRRTTRSAALASVGVALAIALGIPMASADESAERSRQADQLFYDGARRMTEGRLGEGCPMLEESYRLRPAPGTLFTLAECEAKRGKLARAVGHYKEYLRQFEAMTPAQKAGQKGRELIAQSQQNVLKPRVPTLVVELDSLLPPASAVWLDERLLEPLEIGASLPVDPGEHTLLLEVPGRAEVKQSILIAVGEAKTVTLGRSRPAPAKAAPGAVGSRHDIRKIREESAEGAGKSSALLVGGALVSLAAVGTGVGLWIAGAAQHDDADKMAAQIPDTSCENGGSAANTQRCKDLKDANTNGDLLKNIGTGAFVVGGAVALGTVVFALLPTPRRETRQGIRVNPIVTASSGSLWVAGEF